MSRYGEAAVVAAERLSSGKDSDPAKAWKTATKVIFPSSESLQIKGCPKGAFLGLCNEGLIQGLEAGDYSKPTKKEQGLSSLQGFMNTMPY